VRRVKAQKEAWESDACWSLASRMVNQERAKPPITKPTTGMQSPQEMS